MNAIPSHPPSHFADVFQVSMLWRFLPWEAIDRAAVACGCAPQRRRKLLPPIIVLLSLGTLLHNTSYSQALTWVGGWF